MDKITVGVVVGSARRQSYCKKVAECLMGMMPPSFDMRMLDASQLPLYNQDLDDDGAPPEAWTRFREEVAGVNAVLFVTPEYNRSIPPLMKNALDVASRPAGKNVWSGKPGAVVSVTPGSTGAFGANQILRQSMVYLNVFMMQQPEAYLGGIADAVGEDGTITSERTLKFLQKIADGYAAWVQRFF